MKEQKLNKIRYTSPPILFKNGLFLLLFFLTFSLNSIAQGTEACDAIKITGVFNDDPNSDYFQGIIIEHLDAPIQIIKIYNSNWERIEECSGNCTALSSYEAAAGKYFVQVQLYNENWSWICQTDNIEVIVPDNNNQTDCPLSIIAANFPDVVQPGATISLQAMVKNNSTAANVNTNTIGLYQLKGGNNAPPTPVLIAETQIDHLTPGESKTFSFSAILPNPLWNLPTYPIGEESFTNNFVLLTSDNTHPNGVAKCQFPIDFSVDYPDGDLALRLENNEGCIDEQGFLVADLKISNVGTTTAKAPIYIDLDQRCEFGNAEIVTCKVRASNFRAYYILNQDLAPNQSFTIEKPYQLPNTVIDNWTITAAIDALGSAYDDLNEGNNSVTATFTKMEDCGGGGNVSCDNIKVTATPSGELQGTIQILGLNAPIEIVKIYDANWNRVFECNTDCPDQIIYEAEVGKYIIQVQMYDADWRWICQTENIEVEVELNTDCAANLLRDEDGDGICEGADCNDNDPNIGGRQAEGTPCDDRNSTTINDKIQADGCTCQGTPDTGTPDCNAVEVKKLDSVVPLPGTATYEVSGLNAPIEIVKIFNRQTYERLFECNNDCGNEFTIDLPAGEYVAQIQMYTASWGWICGRDIEFDVTITDPGCICTLEFDPVCGSDGITYANACLAECAGVFSWTRGECESTIVDCDNISLSINPSNRQTIDISGLIAPHYIVKVYDEGWNQLLSCTDDCPSVGAYEDGLYRVHVQLYDTDWQYLCETDFLEITIPDNASGSRSIADIDKSKITLFPNPALSTLNIRTYPLKGKTGSIQIYNTFGRQVQAIPTKEFTEDYEFFDVRHYENGLYLLTIKVDNRRVISKRFLVENLK